MELKGAKILDFEKMILSGIEGTESSIIIPHYQRPYSWKDENISTLISDWNREGREEYFAGAIVTVKSSELQELIDGQQRFTTCYLINFVKFCLLRIYIRELVLQRRTSTLLEAFDKLKETSNLVFKHVCDDEFASCRTELAEILTNYDITTDSDTRDSIIEHIKNLLLTHLKISMDLESSDSYLLSTKSLINSLINDRNLRLSYSRHSYNIQLKEALSSTVLFLSHQSFQRLEVNRDTNDEITCNYTDAIKVIFERFTTLENSSEPLAKCFKTIKLIDEFLKKVKFCLIQTGRAEDAYTLFEVLNDRALTLNDLDLIKNQFYKKFCNDNVDRLDNTTIDSILKAREEQWGDRIFVPTLRKQDPTLISYFTTSFLSANTDITFSSKERYRVRINDYLNARKVKFYSESEFARDFNIFECIKEMIGQNGFNLPVQRKHASAIKNEYLNQNSQIYKTMHFLNAVEQHGVMVGLVCSIMNYIRMNISSSFDPEACIKFFAEIKKKGHPHAQLEKIARSLFQISLQAPTAEEPRKAAVELVLANNIASARFDERVSEGNTTKLQKVFSEWLDNWQYSPNDVKIRVLFAKIIRYSNEKLDETAFINGIEEEQIEGLHLDHMEPQNLDGAHDEKYFTDFNRDYYVNGLGNMMPLPGKININKSNKPLLHVFDALALSGLGGHWITTRTKDLFEENNSNGIPHKEFFDRRKDFIKNVFLNSISTI